MNLVLWITAMLLCAVFLTTGVLKLTLPKEKLAAAVRQLDAGTVKTIGALEVLAAVGLILPAVLGILPVLVPLSALGLVLVMVGAIVIHLRRHEAPAIMANILLLGLSAFVAWGRLGPVSFTG